MLRRSVTAWSNDNLTARLNAAARSTEGRKWGKHTMGIPHKPRLEMKSIHTVHETKNVIVAGRNKCNGFNSNQYLVADKRAGECVLVDMADDWPDDWDAYIRSAGLTVKCIFFTHLHLDNVLGLPTWMDMNPDTRLAWCEAERYWVDKFPAACVRYKRTDLMRRPLPFATGKPGSMDLLSCATNRATSYLQLGNTMLFYIHTPGHSPGHMMLHLPLERLLFTGDVLLHDQVGRVDLPMATGRELARSLRSLEDLPDNTAVLPGHGRITTLARERTYNRGLRRLYELMEAGVTDPSVGFNDSGPL